MDRVQNGSHSKERRHFSPQQKMVIVKEHLVDGVVCLAQLEVGNDVLGVFESLILVRRVALLRRCE